MSLAGQSSTSREDEESLEVGVEMKLGEVFASAQVIVNTDVSDLLAEYENTMKAEEGQAYMPNKCFQATREYVDRFKSLKKRATVATIQKMLLDDYKLSEFEKGLLINLAPEEVEEAKALVPSLEDETRFTDEIIERMLEDMKVHKEFE
uniref:DNA-directed RNA polymerase II subunit D n=1 Tax=Tetraselmis sp. GSL018 TaxID=582737 RepID=A0A061S1Y2_9CHLO